MSVGAVAQTAADIEGSSRQSDTIFRQQQERLQEDLRNARKPQLPQEGANLERFLPQTGKGDASTACHPIQEIEVLGVSQLAPKLIQEVTQPVAGQCLGVAGIESLLGELTRQYIERGYVTTRVYLPAQDLKSGKLTLQVMEGAIEGYRIDGEESGIHLPNAFPKQPGDLLNLRDLEQGIDQINRLGSNSATLDIEPGTSPGSSVVVVRNQKKSIAHLLMSADNQGSESTGTHNALLSLTLDSPLDFSERFVVTRRESFTPERSGHSSTNDAVEVWVPYGYHSLTTSYSKSNYLNIITTSNGTNLRSEGESNTSSVGVDSVVYRDQRKRISASAKLTNVVTENYLERQRLSVSSRTLTFVELSANGFILLPDTMLSGQVGYTEGIDALNALKDAPDLTDDAPRAQFRRVGIDVSLNRNFRLGARDFSWSSQWNGQYGLTTLYGSQQILVGSQASVRGFNSQSLSGDHGYYFRNELATPVSIALANEVLSGRLYVGYDFGEVRSRAAGAGSGSLSGMAVGMSMRWRSLSWDLSATRALNMPSTMNPEPTSVWFRFSSSI